MSGFPMPHLVGHHAAGANRPFRLEHVLGRAPRVRGLPREIVEAHAVDLFEHVLELMRDPFGGRLERTELDDREDDAGVVAPDSLVVLECRGVSDGSTA